MIPIISGILSLLDDLDVLSLPGDNSPLSLGEDFERDECGGGGDLWLLSSLLLFEDREGEGDLELLLLLLSLLLSFLLLLLLLLLLSLLPPLLLLLLPLLSFLGGEPEPLDELPDGGGGD